MVASCPSGYSYVGVSCVDSRDLFISDSASCTCVSGTVGPDALGWCQPDIVPSAASCTCAQGNAIAGICFRSLGFDDLKCPSDVSSASLNSLRSYFSSLSSSVRPICKEACKKGPGVLSSLRSLSKEFCTNTSQSCAVDCEDDACDACDRVCDGIVEASSGAIVDAIDFVQTLQSSCSSSKRHETRADPTLCQITANNTIDWDDVQLQNGDKPSATQCQNRPFSVVSLTFFGQAESFFGTSEVQFSVQYCLKSKPRVAGFKLSVDPSTAVEDLLEEIWKVIWKKLF